MIYVIKCTKTKSCKIGFSSNPESRLAQLQTGNPFSLELVAEMEGCINDEKLLHEKFKEFRLNGEWFEYIDEIKEYFKIEEFYLMYSSMVIILKQSSDIKMKLFAALLERYSSGQEFAMNGSLKEVIAKETNCNPRSFDNAFTFLVKSNIVVKISSQLYKVNPRHAFQGSSQTRNQELKSIIKLHCKNC